jgi:hypothetical protein
LNGRQFQRDLQDPSMSFQYAAHHHQLAQVISIVVCHQERFTKQGLSFAMRNFGGEIASRIGDQLAYGFKVSEDLFHAFVPGFVAGRRFGFGPVFVRPLGRRVFGIFAELKDVPLGNADMLQQLPGSVRTAIRLAAAQFAGEVFERLAQINMRFSLGKQVDDVLADRTSFLHGIYLDDGLTVNESNMLTVPMLVDSALQVGHRAPFPL